MADTIDGLYIEIESGATTAGSQLDMLTSKLEGLKKTVGSSTPLKTFSRNYQTLIDTINNSTGIEVSKLEGLRAFTQVMSNMNGIKISSSIATQLNNLDFVVQHLSGESLDGLYSFITALSELNKLQGVSISASFVKNLQGIADFASKIQGQNFSSLNELTTALANLAPLANADTASIKGLTTSVRTLSNTTRTASSRGRTFNTVLANIRVRTLALVRVTQMIRRATTTAIGTYGDYIETLNLFKMAMGSAGQEAYEFAEKAQAILGIDLTQWMKAQGVFNALASGFGVAGDRAAIMSKNLTQLAYDISSFYNIDVETAIEKVRSGFSGQIRPVRDLGYDLSQARLEAIALSLGIDKTVKSMTQAEKSQLRYIALMTQLKQVQGDLSRTLDSPINQMRILQAQLQQMYRSIGMTLLPILNKVLPYLNAILRVIKMIADEIAAMFGYTLPRITSGDWSSSVVTGAEDIEDELDSATGAAEKLKNTLAGFDQINLISSKSGGGGSGAGSANVGGGAFDFDLPEYDFLGDAVENKAQQIAERIRKTIDPLVNIVKGLIIFTVENLDNIVLLLETIALVSIGKNLVNKVAGLFALTNTQLDGVKKVLDSFGLVVIGLTVSFIGGKDIAKGNIAQGILESAIGGALAMRGGYLLFGPAGAVIGLATSIIMTFEGYRAEKVEQLRKRINEDFMKLFPDQTQMEELSKSWTHFVEQFFNPEIDEKNSAAARTKETVDEIGRSLAELQIQYATGTITGAQYATNVELMYGQMEEAVKTHLENVGDAIMGYLNGPFGLYLQAHGYNINEIQENVKKTTEQVVAELEKNRLKLQELNHEYAIGKLTKEEYEQKTKDLLGPMQAQYELLGLNSEKTSEFIKNFSNLNINFSDWDSVTQKLNEIKQGYTDASTEIDKNKEALKSYFTTLRDSSSTDDMREYYQALIDEADNFATEQKRILNSNYQDLLESIESSGTIHWERVYNEDGLEDTHDALYKHMKDLDDQIAEMYGGAGITRNETYWKSLMALMDDFEENAANGIGSMEGYIEEWESQFDGWSDKYKIYLFEQKQATRGLTDAETQTLRKLREQYGITDKDIKTYTNNGMYYESLYSAAAKKEMEARNYVWRNGQEEFIGETELSASAYKNLGALFGNESILVDPLYSTMMSTGYVMGAPEVVNNFLGGANRLMGNVAYTIADNKGNIQKAYMGAMNVPLQPVVKLGAGLGQAIADGIASSSTYIEQATKEGTKGAAKELNRFGEGFAQFMREISSSTMTGFDAFYQAMGVGSMTYTPPKIKTPRVKGYATGGFPDTADFFYANENGVPEYVGTMGGRTAVATNTDIVKGVSDGVYRAIASTGIQNDVRKIANKNGKVVFAPSEEAGRVMQQSVDMYNGTGSRY